MNTPRSKPPKRFEPYIPKDKIKNIERGTYSQGIHNDTAAISLGVMVGLWVHVEEAMVQILRELCGDSSPLLNFPARLIFRSVVNQQARIKIMRSLLELSMHNREKPIDYDEIIDEFDKLNDQRNKLLHGLWWTRHDGRLYYEEASLDNHSFLTSREVETKEIDDVTKRMDALIMRIYLDLGKRASHDSNPPQPGDSTR